MCFTKYYKNFILCGDANHHCMLCVESFYKLDDIEKHIRWEKHRKVIKTQNCLAKFKNDAIFKLGKYYYCQYCNHVVNDIALVKEHIGTEKHTFNKTAPEPTTKRIQASYDSGAVMINNVKIDSNEWHGIQNKCCLLCNTAVANVLKHIETQDHIVRLIQTATKYEGEDICYRKINSTTFQCFTCRNTFSSEDFDKHWQNHNKTPIELQKVDSVCDKIIRIYDRAQYYKIEDNEYDVAKLADIDDEFFNVKNNEIICKLCNIAVRNATNNLQNHLMNKHNTYSFTKSNIIEQIRKDIEKEYVFIFEKDSGKARHDLSVYGKQHHIKLNAGGSKGYCTLCDRFMSAHINIFKQHVGGSLHNSHLEIKGQIKPKKHPKGSARTELFSRHLVKIDYITDFEAVAMNMRFCIDRDSFLLMKRIEHGKHFKMTKCFVCDVTFKWWEEKEHCENKTHKDYVLAAKVVIEKFNFIREIKPKLYHCGVCNVTLPYWDTLAKHIEDLCHKTHVMAKDYKTTMTHFLKQHGNFPEAKKIELSMNSDVLYSNMLKVLYETWLGNLRVYNINLQELEKSKSNILILTH